MVYLVCLFFMVLGFSILLRHFRKMSSYTARATALVLRMEERDNSDSLMDDDQILQKTQATYQVPILQYRVNGALFTQAWEVHHAFKKYAPGMSVTIQCDPANPAKFILKGEYTPMFIGGIIMAMGLAGMLFF